MICGLITQALTCGVNKTLIRKSITENGNYDPADEDPEVDGYSYVEVSVETYEDELAEALAALEALQQCQERVATAVGAITGTVPQSCEDIAEALEDDIPGIISDLEDEKEEAEEEAQECNDCKAQVVSKIQQYVPNFNPQTCQEIVVGIDDVYDAGEEAAEGFEFPAGTEYDPDIVSIVGDASVEDVTLGITLVWKYTGYDSYGPNRIEWGYIQGGEYHYITSTSNSDPTAILTNKYIKVTDPTTGKMEIAWDYTYAGGSYTWHEKTYPTVSALIGFGASGHEFKAKNI